MSQSADATGAASAEGGRGLTAAPLTLEVCCAPCALSAELISAARDLGISARLCPPPEPAEELTDPDAALDPRFGLEPPWGAEGAEPPPALRDLLAPLRPPLLEHELNINAPPTRGAWRLHLRDPEGLAAARVVVQGASAPLAERLAGELRGCGLAQTRAQLGAPLRAVVRYGGAAPLALAIVSWRAARLGLEVAWERVWGEHEREVWLYAPNPARRGERLRASAPLWLWCDDDERAEPLRAALAAAGYDARLAPSGARLADEPEAMAGVSLGPLAEDPDEGERLRALVGALLAQEGADPARYPPRLLDPTHPLLLALAPHDMNLRVLSSNVLLPTAAARAGRLLPRGGGEPARWSVRVACDDEALGAEAVAALRAAGFSRAALAARAGSGRGRLGLEVRWGEARAFPKARLALWGALARLGAPRALEPRAEEPEGRWEAPSLDPDEVLVTLHAADLDPARRLARLRAAAAGLELIVCAEGGEGSPLALALADLRPAALEVLEPERWGELLETLPTPSRALSERVEEAQGSARARDGGLALARPGLALSWGEVRCGRAPLGLVAWVQREVERCAGHRPSLVRDARLAANEVWVLA